jgi:LmbE family N-acetylglucosaminyl deacetylase
MAGSKDSKPQRVMVVSAHPDDAEFSAGGTVAALSRAGAEVVYVICTDGAQGGEDPGQKDKDLVAVRKREQRAAARVLGVSKVEFLGFRDGHLAPDLKLRRAIVAMIRKHKPEVVITHSPVRDLEVPMPASHPDHLAAGEATFAAVYPDARNPRAWRKLLKKGLEPHAVHEIWVPSFAGGEHIVDISETLAAKFKAIAQHKSQVAKPGEEWDYEKWMRVRHAEAGKKAGYQYAESFKRIVV